MWFEPVAFLGVDHQRDVHRARGVKLSMRLVKGAYWDTEIKRAQTIGLADFPVFTAKNHTDLNYMHCAQILRDAQDAIFPAFASHNAMTLAFVAELFAGADYELQRLHGMGEGAHDAIVDTLLAMLRGSTASCSAVTSGSENWCTKLEFAPFSSRRRTR